MHRASGLQTRFKGDCDDVCSPEPLVGDGSAFFAVGAGVLPWGP